MTFFNGSWTPNRLSGAAITNAQYVSGYYYGSDANIAYTENEWTLYSGLPAAVVVPLLTSRSVLMGPVAKLEAISQEVTTQIGTGDLGGGGGTTPLVQNQAGFLWVGTVAWPTTLTAEGYLTHEWGHAVDNQFMYEYGGSGFQLTHNDPTINAAWTRSITFMPGNTPSPSNFYGWLNIREYWAELFRWHRLGSHGANVATAAWSDGSGSGFGHTGLTPDEMFRGLISGPSAEPGPDDSFAAAMHTYISGLVAPFPTQPIPQ